MLSRFNKRKIVLFHIGRSGSTVLCDLLNQHPAIYWDGEVYETLFQSLNIHSVTSRHPDLPSDPVTYLQPQINNHWPRYYGFELKFFHLKLLNIQLEEYINRLSRRGFSRFVILKRRNFLKKIVSSLIAHELDQYHLQESDDVKLHQVHLHINEIRIDRDVKPLGEFLRDYEQSFQKLDYLLAQKQTLTLNYEEDILPDPQIGYRRMCDFLRIKPAAARVHFVRTNPFALKDLIKNFDEVEQALIGTPFEWMLYE